MGELRPDPGAAFAYRHSIGADDIAMFTNLTPEFASPLSARAPSPTARTARTSLAARRSSRAARRRAFSFADLEEAKAAVPESR